MRSDAPPELDVARIRTSFRRVVKGVCPEHLPIADKVLARIAPERWTLEWQLPWWLGNSFGLARTVAADLVLSNVLGLSAIRLEDDLLDGDVASDEIAASEMLAEVLLGEALAIHRGRFRASSSFWAYVDSCLSTWRTATGAQAPTRSPGPLVPRNRFSWRPAALGAPLKISAYAACLLADRVNAFDDLDRCLDHALTALVMYDHVCDWETDLRAGRWNSFVALATDSPQLLEAQSRTRSRTLFAMMTSDLVTRHYAEIAREMERAIVVARELQLTPMAFHLQALANRYTDQGVMTQRHYSGLASRAAQLLLNPSPM